MTALAHQPARLIGPFHVTFSVERPRGWTGNHRKNLVYSRGRLGPEAARCQDRHDRKARALYEHPWSKSIASGGGKGATSVGPYGAIGNTVPIPLLNPAGDTSPSVATKAENASFE